MRLKVNRNRLKNVPYIVPHTEKTPDLYDRIYYICANFSIDLDERSELLSDESEGQKGTRSVILNK